MIRIESASNPLSEVLPNKPVQRTRSTAILLSSVAAARRCIGLLDLFREAEYLDLTFNLVSIDMKGKVNIGTSGFRIPRAEYTQLLSCVEIQHTFYQPPQALTLERWREEAPPGFEFTLKAWQLITHEAKSPTYKRLKKQLSEIEKREVGSFKSSSLVREAWEVTLACAKALKAKTILFQCPASFKQTRENISNLQKIISGIKQRKFNFCWEPRGDWDNEVVKSICQNLNLWHVVDPFASKSATPGKCYFRLHGRKGWRYKYEEGELEELATMLPESKSSYIFFNNIYMTEDALKFREMISKRENANS